MKAENMQISKLVLLSPMDAFKPEIWASKVKIAFFLGHPVEWSEWSEWNSCSASCGGGTRTSQRKCFPSISVCQGKGTKTKKCNMQKCPGNRVIA